MIRLIKKIIEIPFKCTSDNYPVIQTVLSLLFTFVQLLNKEQGLVASPDISELTKMTASIESFLVLCLANPHPKCRELGMEVMRELHELHKKFHLLDSERQDLIMILEAYQKEIPENAIFCFIQRDATGHKLFNPNFDMLSFEDVLRSDFNSLYRFYLGDFIAKLKRYARELTIHGCSYLIKQYIIPYVRSKPQWQNMDDYLDYYRLYAMLLMPMAEILVMSEDGMASSVTLFDHFKNILLPVSFLGLMDVRL
jgi:hypothetical protein